MTEPGHDANVTSRAVSPSPQDLAIAEEVILGTLASGQTVHHRDNLVQRVRERLANEPLPELFHQLDDVTEQDCRAAWSMATAITALAALQWSGQILPCDALSPVTGNELILNWRSRERGGGPLRNLQPEYAYPIATQLRLAPWLTAIGPDAIAGLRRPIPGAGAKIIRVLREAAESYHRAQYVAAAMLLGIASEAAWVELAEAVAAKTNDAELARLLASERAHAAALAERTTMLLPTLVRPRPEHEVRRLAIEAAHLRDLRDHAAHEPSASFDEDLFTRAAVGIEMQNAVGYFRRLYAAVAAVRG